jgi:hypothetical protein
MEKEEPKQKARQTWVKGYEQLGFVNEAARRCGRARSSLQKRIMRLAQNQSFSLSFLS